MAETNGTLTKHTKAPTPFTSFSLMMDEHSELLQREPDTSEKSNYLTEIQAFFDRAKAIGAVLENEDERRTAQSILNYWITVLYRANVGKPDDTTLAEYNPKLILKMDDAQCPYPGVRAFREDENRLFFGRQRQINYMLGRLREDRLLAVVGPSGSGKTSIVLAGLLPEMKQNDKLNNIERYFFPIITPGSRPLENLDRMFQSPSETPLAKGSAKQTAVFQQDSYHLSKRIEQFTTLPAVIVIDQFEEIFTRANDRDRYAFIANLARVIQAPNAKHIVILTMRDDNYDSYLRRPERFRKALDPAKVSLPQLGSMELREAIEKPAAYVRLRFEEPTIKALVRETISEPVGLPLLQFTLFKLWTRHEQKEDINKAFNEMRSCRALLASSAEEFFKKLDLLDQVSCFRLLSQLIKIDGDLKAYSYPVRRADLYLRTEKNSRVDSLIERLAQQQLIRLCPGSMPADDEVELVHDSLLRSWPRMVSWVASKKRAQWWSKIAAGVLFAVLIFALCLWGALWWSQKQQHDDSRELARRSNKAFNNNRFDQALLLGREAYAVEPNATTRSNLLRLLYALQSTSQPMFFLPADKFEPEDMVFSAENGPKPARLAALDYKGEIVIWNLSTEPIEKTVVSAKKATFPLAFSPDGKTLASASLEPEVTLILHDLESRQSRNLTQKQKEFAVTSLAFAPDGKTVVTGDQDGNVVQWDLRNTNGVKPTLLYKHPNPRSDTYSIAVSSIVFSVSGNLLASGSYDGTAILSDLRLKGGQRRTLAARGEVKGSPSDTEYKRIFSLAFSPEENLLAAGSGDEVFIWNITTGKQVEEFSSGLKPAGILVSFSEDGTLLTAFSFEGAIILWDLTAGRTVGRQFYKPAATHSAAFSNNGKLLALPGEDGVVVWDVFSQRILTVGGTINSIAFSPSPDDKMLASGTGDGSLTLWKTTSPEKHERIGDPIHEASGIVSLAFSGDGRLLAAGLQDGTISLRDLNDFTQQIKALDAQKGELVKKVSSDAGELATAESEAADADLEVPTPSSPPPPIAVSKVVFSPVPGSHLLAAAIVIKPGEKQTVEADEENYGPSKIILWNTDQTTSTELLTGPDSVVTSLAFSPDGEFLACGSADKKKNYKIILWKGQKQEDPIPSADRVSSLAFSRKRQILAAGLDNGQILLWDLAARRRLGDEPLEGLVGRVTDLAFSLDSTTLAVVTNKKLRHPQQGVITLWDVETREPIGNPLLGHDGTISAIAFSGDGKILASGSGDDFGSGDASQNENNIILWDLDIEGADQRFCDIVVCQPVREKSWLQLLYRKISSWFNAPA